MKLLLKDLALTKTIDEKWILQNCYIAGGACVSSATRQPVHDVDIYFKTKEARDKFIREIGEEKYISKTDGVWLALLQYDFQLKNGIIKKGENKQIGEYSISSFKEHDILYFQCLDDVQIPYPLFEKQKWMFENGYDFVVLDRNHFEVDGKRFLGNKSITIKKNDMIYQFILRFYGEPKQTMDDTFDFQHCKIAYDLATRDYVASPETWECLSKREIRYINSFYPISSLKRMYKYAGRGFTYNNDQFVKIVRDIHALDVDNKFVVEDQLIGYYEDFDYNIVFIEDDVCGGLLK